MLSPLTADTLNAIGGVRHGFFTRDGGVSSGLYASLNCGFGSGDDKTAVAENRARVAANLGALNFGAQAPHVLTPYQIHSAEAVIVEKPIAMEDLPRADALVTRTPGLAIGVLTADCTPVLFADPERKIVGAAHAGWRGAVGGVLEATLARMEELGADRARIIAAIGPCISQPNYEVGEDFEANLIGVDAANKDFFSRSSGEARPRFDLSGYVASRLRTAGIGTIGMANPCTYASEFEFFQLSTHHTPKRS